MLHSVVQCCAVLCRVVFGSWIRGERKEREERRREERGGGDRRRERERGREK